VFTDPDVAEAVLKLVGTDLPPAAGPAPDDAGEDQTAPPVLTVGPDIRPALGEPAEVAKTLVAEARNGVDVVRLVAGDPLSEDAVGVEVSAVSKTHLPFEIVPGLPATVAVPTYAGLHWLPPRAR
jgi:uroporphyrinogen III methyltransferase/synthase